MAHERQRVLGLPARTVGGWAGVGAFVIILVASLLTLDAPQFSDSVADHRQWFANNETTIALLTWLLPIAYVLLLLFASGLRSILGAAEDEGVWSRFSFAAAIMMVSAAGVGWAYWAALGLDDVLSAASDETVRTLSAVFIVTFSAVVATAQAAWMLGASIVILTTRVMPKWIGWYGSLGALLAVLASLWRLSGDPEGLISTTDAPTLLLLWTIVVSIAMIRSDRSTVSD